MGLDGVLRPVQARGNGLSVQPADHELQHLLLPVRELDEELPERLGGRPSRRGQDHGEQVGRKPGPAQERGPRRGDDVLGRSVLGHKADSTRPNGTDRRRRVRIGGQDHHPGRLRAGRQQRREVDAVGLAELHIHDHHVGPAGRHDADDLVRVGHRGQGLEVRLGAEDGLQPFGNDRVVIDDEQLDRRHAPTAGCSTCQPLMSTIPSRTA